MDRRLLDDDTSALSANCAMNRERQLAGPNVCQDNDEVMSEQRRLVFDQADDIGGTWPD